MNKLLLIMALLPINVFSQTSGTKNDMPNLLIEHNYQKTNPESVVFIKGTNDIELAGVYLEKAGKLKNTGIGVAVGSGCLGLMIITMGDEPAMGSIISGMGVISAGVMSVAGNFLIKKAGKALRNQKNK